MIPRVTLVALQCLPESPSGRHEAWGGAEAKPALRTETDSLPKEPRTWTL